MLFGFNHVFELFHQVYSAHKVDFQDFFVDTKIGVQGFLALRDACVEHKEVDTQVVGNHVVIE